MKYPHVDNIKRLFKPVGKSKMSLTEGSPSFIPNGKYFLDSISNVSVKIEHGHC